MPNNNRYTTLYKSLTFLLLITGLSACQTPSGVTPAIDQSNQDNALESAPEKTLDAETLLHNQAISAAMEGKTELALEHFATLLEKNPFANKVFTNLGLLYLQMNDTAEAKKAFLNAIEQDSQDAVAYNHLAIIQRQEGEFKQALFNYYKAINADPEYASAHLNLGILFDLYLQELPKALEQYLLYQKLTHNKNEDVAKWIIDLQRRIDNSSNDSP